MENKVPVFDMDQVFSPRTATLHSQSSSFDPLFCVHSLEMRDNLQDQSSLVESSVLGIMEPGRDKTNDDFNVLQLLEATYARGISY